MFKPGCIRRIEVFDFVTYSHVDVFPGPNLNMIIGPNGTGKSTLVAAIILGLGGNPKTVGRGKKVSDYVKHGCSHAVINVHLQDKNGIDFIIIMRTFDTHNKTQWRINGNSCSAKDVINCVQHFNIQIDNLCQFLPQDRVADFAKLNSKELLKETQLALCRDDLLEKQEFLISSKSRHATLIKELDKANQLLQQAINANSRLEARVQNVHKRSRYEEKIQNIDRKIVWCYYKEARDKLRKQKEEKATAQKMLLKVQSLSEPAQIEIKKHKTNLIKWQQDSTNIMQKVRNVQLEMNSVTEKLEVASDKIIQADEEIARKLAEIEQVDKQIEEANTKLAEMERMYNTLLENVNRDAADQQTNSDEISKRLAYIEKLNTHKDSLEQLRTEILSENKALQIEQLRIENVKQHRLEKLRMESKDAFEAVNWLRNNRQQFEDEIFDPILLELNMIDKNKSKYVEAMIPKRDKIAFTCVNKNDMSKLIRLLREEKKLSVNILYAGSETENYDVPDLLTENLQRFGFYTFVSKLFTAPEPIMRYLCRTYNLHRIPVGSSNINSVANQVPRQYSVFFSDSHRFAVKYSSYTNAKCITQNIIKSDGSLALNVDLDKLQTSKIRYEDNRVHIADIDSKIEALDVDIAKIETSLNAFRDKIKSFQKQKQQLELFKNRTDRVRRDLQEMKQNKLIPNEIQQEGKNKKQKFMQAIASLHADQINNFQRLQKLVIKHTLTSISTEISRQNIDAIDTKIIDLKQKLEQAEEEYRIVSKKYSDIFQEAKKLLQNGKEISKGFTPSDDGFDEFRTIYDQLPDTVGELNAIKEKISSKIACLTTADTGEVEEYETRKQQIEITKEEINSIENEIATFSQRMATAEEEWLKPLKELLSRINVNFAEAFRQMGCAGEVSLSEADNKNYADYGISIKVTYRNNESLQELNSNVQSGGERAVATAAFILSLQELTPVPFRCVDEINQGMDTTNERRIFDFIVKTTCQANTSQYFLITPKLVPNLSYDKRIDVHIVHNGVFVKPNNRWSLSKMCNSQEVPIANS